MITFSEYACDGRVRREAEALAGRGDTVDCICVGSIDTRPVAGVRLIRVSANRYRGANAFRLLLAYLRFFATVFFKLTVMHLAHRYDVIEVHTMPDFLVFATLIPKLTGAKVILNVHDLMPEIYAVKFASGEMQWVSRFIAWVERISIAFADRALCVHRPHLQALMRHGNPESKFSILLNVPDHRFFVPKSPPGEWRDEFRLLYHGTTPKRAGLDVALRAVALARKDIPRIQFQIVGVAEGAEELSRLVAELGLEDCVAMAPSVPVEQLSAIIDRTHVAIVPYLSDTFTQYVLPVKLLECVAMRRPVIVSRLRTVEAYFDSSMVKFFEPGNDRELAESIVELYRNPELAKELADNAEAFTARYNWPEHRQIYFRLIDSLNES
jgi:glycosyltransferase involved in cell wall biosynthesis